MQWMFTGKYQHTMDGQRRISVPKAWRGDGEELPTFVLIPGHGRRIHVIPMERFERLLVRRAERVDIGATEENDALEQLGSQMHICQCDKAGRINLTEELKNHAGLEEDVVLLGAVTDFRIYRPDVWQDRQQPVELALHNFKKIQDGG